MVATSLAVAPTAEPSTTEWIPLADLDRDPAVNTRPVDHGWVTQRVAVFDPNALGTLSVSVRTDGTTIILDGQNRAELCRRAGWGDQRVLCRIYTGLTLQQEAGLFRALNDNRRVRTIYKFLARVTEGELGAVAINTVVQQLGWKISDQAGPTHITAVVSLERIYVGDRRQNKGVPDLGAVVTTLNVVTEAWGHRSEAVNGQVLIGVGQVIGRYGEAIAVPELVKRLSTYPGGPTGLLGDARGLQRYQGGSVANSISDVIVKRYNERRRTNKLPDWQ